jgi:hypothetical protein
MNDLKKQIDKIKDSLSDITSFKPEEHYATMEDFTDYGKIDVYDYEGELFEITIKSKKIIDDLAKAYLEHDPIINQPYIKSKIEKDSDYYAYLDFLINNSKRALINISKQIDQGSHEPRMYDALSMLQKEMRENIKLSSTHLVNVEKFYKSLREDIEQKKLALDKETKQEMKELKVESTTNNVETSETSKDDYVMDRKTLNKLLREKDIEDTLED